MNSTRRTVASTAGLALGAMLVAGLPAAALTNASWLDDEWVSGTQGGDEPGIGTLDCTAEGIYSSRGAAAYLGADAVGLGLLDFGTLSVTNDGTDSTPVPGSATETPPSSNKYYDVFNLALLNTAVQAQLPTITIPLNTDLGALGEFGEAQSTGYSAAAVGLIAESGGLAELDGYPEEDLPLTATLSLANIVDQVLPPASPLVAYLAGLELEIGVTGSHASLDACFADWDGSLDGHLVRDYLIAALDLDISSPLVSDIATLITTALTSIEAARVAALAELVTDLTAVLTPIDLGILALADISVDATVTVDTAALSAALSQVYNGNDIVELDLVNGTIGVDIARLLGHPVDGLNNMEANRELLVDGDAIDALEAAVLDAISDLLAQLTAAATTVANSISITGSVTANVSLAGTPIAGLVVPLAGGSVSITLLDPDYCDNPLNTVTCAALTAAEGLLNLALGDIVSTVTGAVTDLTTAVNLITQGLITTLTAINQLDSDLVSLVSAVLDPLFGVDGLVSIIVNAQNDPQPANANPIPPEFGSLPSGQYDIAALRVGVLDFLGEDLNVDLVFARSSVGINSPLP